MEKLNLPSNTRKDKEIRKQKIIKGKVIKKKKTFSRKMADIFIGEDVDNVGSYIFRDVIVPAIKNTLSDAVQGGIEMLLFGESTGRRGSRGRGNDRPNVSYYGKVNYSKPTHREPQRVSRRTSTVDDIVLDSHRDAQEVLNSLVDMIDEYGHATVSDLQDLIGMTGSFTDNNYGWYNLSNSRIRRVRLGYLLDLPKPVHLD